MMASQNSSILTWRPAAAPATQYAYTRALPPRRKGLLGAYSTPPTLIVPCRARVGGDVLLGEVLLPTVRPDATRERCHVVHQLHGLRVEKRFDVLTVQVPDAGATACSAHCQAQLHESLPGATDLYSDGRLLANDAGSCCALCRATHGCVAFVYYMDGSGQCELKAFVTKLQQGSVADLQQCATGHALVVGGLVREAAVLDTSHCIPMHAVHANRAYQVPEGASSLVAAASMAECCHQCKEHALCRTFTWHKVLHTCSLHFATSDAVPSLQHVSGVLRK